MRLKNCPLLPDGELQPADPKKGKKGIFLKTEKSPRSAKGGVKKKSADGGTDAMCKGKNLLANKKNLLANKLENLN
jgi:hypothetical protein